MLDKKAKYMPIWGRYGQMFADLDSRELGDLMKMMYNYFFEGIEPEVCSASLKGYWCFVRMDLKDAVASYETKSRNGQKGGQRSGEKRREAEVTDEAEASEAEADTNTLQQNEASASKTKQNQPLTRTRTETRTGTRTRTGTDRQITGGCAAPPGGGLSLEAEKTDLISGEGSDREANQPAPVAGAQQEQTCDHSSEQNCVASCLPVVASACVSAKPAEAERSSAPVKAYGEYGWVKLTDPAYRSLQALMGTEELTGCIAYIDGCAQSTGNRNHWKDWSAVLKRCHANGWHRPARRASPEKLPTGATGELGEEELQAIQRLLAADVP